VTSTEPRPDGGATPPLSWPAGLRAGPAAPARRSTYHRQRDSKRSAHACSAHRQPRSSKHRVHGGLRSSKHPVHLSVHRGLPDVEAPHAFRRARLVFEADCLSTSDSREAPHASRRARLSVRSRLPCDIRLPLNPACLSACRALVRSRAPFGAGLPLRPPHASRRARPWFEARRRSTSCFR
jgi:hypothetical protein